MNVSGQLKGRDLQEYYAGIFTILSVALWGLTIYYATTRGIFLGKYVILFLGLTYLVYSFDILREGDERFKYEPHLLIGFGVIFTISTIYLFQNYEVLKTVRMGYATDVDYLFAIVVVGITLYYTWRSYGLPFLSVIFIAIIYAYFGPYMPGLIEHTGLNARRLLQILVTDINGIYGSLSKLVASWIALFILYAGLMQGYGAFDTILDVSLRTTKYIKSGVAQSGVIASMVIGSINGSATANTGITGSLTIPLMKRYGLKPSTAGGIEAVASTGGQIVPPVMGASAFIMANLIDFSYWEIVSASIIPAVIFYLALFVTVHITAIKQLDLSSELKISVSDIDAGLDEPKSKQELGFEAIQFGIPFVVLIYYLGILQYTVMTSALYTCTAMVITGIGIPVARQPSLESVQEQLGNTLRGAKIGAALLAPIAIIIAAINGIVDILLATGVPGTIALTLILISGGVLAIAAILSVIICIILGLGMPTSAAYLVVAVLIAPGLTREFGVPPLAAHYFVLYSTILATITPPIATGVAVAAGIAKTGFWDTAKEAMKIGGPLYILPFMFIYHPEMISPVISLESIESGVIALVGALVMVYGFNLPNQIHNDLVRYATQIVFIILGPFIMIHPNRTFQIIGIVVATIAFVSLNIRTILTGLNSRFGELT